MGDHRLPKRVILGELENAGKRGLGGTEKQWTDCVVEDRRVFGITGDWSTVDSTLGFGAARQTKRAVGECPRA